jgi:hypothetical protein
VFGVLKGFAYEKGAFTMREQLRQRRRWVRGILYAIRRSPVLSRRRRLTIAYSAASWFSALPSVIVLVASVFLHYGPLLYFTSFFTGFIWISMVTGYVVGARLNSSYLGTAPGYFQLFCLGMAGALVDVTAPWYALFTQTSIHDFVRKDPVRATSLATSGPARPQRSVPRFGQRVPLGASSLTSLSSPGARARPPLTTG